jgi:hypothetical protein
VNKKFNYFLFSPESPRDASSKDSPASQADSGVFSIASSNSPSKVDGATNGADGTSPESPNRDRMGGFSEQALMSRDLHCKFLTFNNRNNSLNFKSAINLLENRTQIFQNTFSLNNFETLSSLKTSFTLNISGI